MRPAAVRKEIDPAPLTISLLVLAQMLAARLTLTADGELVRFLGTPIGSACSFRAHFGIPCPTCGMTRSLVLALRGDIGKAVELNPGGPAAILGLLAFSLGLLWLTAMKFQGDRQRAASVSTGLRSGALVYAALGVAVWIGGWVYRIV
jgi:hypothetical protein